ncbi:AIPR family protein [Gordonia amicalis]|uniref:AIPR family protein n=1 Tax=Gordonia TaxID=2053 RepID=UPI0017869547|nr:MULTISPECIES: AIPR family protein [Gordonia]UPW12201.1 AIPR family protein [Gordonia amicalis]
MTDEATADETPSTKAGRSSACDGPGWIALTQRDDLVKYGAGNAIALFAAELRLGIDDIDTFAADALTDHSNDKKCDLVAVDRGSGQLIVAQAYAAAKPETKNEGPASKASDLNTAVTWLLSGDISTLPEVLRDAATESRDALESGEITDLQIWSVHNCPEGTNVQNELNQAVRTADSLIRRYFPDAQVNVSSMEIGERTIDELYRRTHLPILVEEPIEFTTLGGFELSGSDWKAYNTAVKLSRLRELWQSHGTDLMSPNIRDYLGVRRSQRNINYGIKTTAKESPRDFFIYNNGITAVVHSFEVANDTLTVRGLGIVNGGQTTGSIGTLSDTEASDLGDSWVQIRFVTSANSDVLENVVRYNNTQNKIEAADFRSRDSVQERLRTEFQAVPDALYRGGRRGGADDAMKRDRRLLADSAVAQSLAAFHGYPNLAYNELGQIWENDPTYARFFNDNLNARHIVFCYSLLKAIEAQKSAVNSIPDDERTQSQKSRAEFFRSRGGIHLLTAAIGNSIETILNRAVPNRFSLRFTSNLSPATATDTWAPVVQTCAAFTKQLSTATNLGLKSTDRVRDALALFESMIEATRGSDPSTFDTFASAVELS